MNTPKALSLIGLCRRAGGAVPGAVAALDTLRRGKARALLVSCDASDRTKKQAMDKASTAGVALCVIAATSDELGYAIGLSSPCAVVALTGKGPWESALSAARCE